MCLRASLLLHWLMHGQVATLSKESPVAVVVYFVDCNIGVDSARSECTALIPTMLVYNITLMISIVGFIKALTGCAVCLLLLGGLFHKEGHL